MIDPDETRSYYPDLVGKGLVRCVQELLNETGSNLMVQTFDMSLPFPAYAHVENGSRSSQIYIGAKERLFLPDFWSRGVCLGSGKTSDLRSLAAAIQHWNVTETTIGELAARFNWITPTDDAFAYEQGNEVEHRWLNYVESIKVHFPELEPFVLAAAACPQLRQLFPFTSMNRFCFSRCTGYPFTRDTPVVVPTRNGAYEVHDCHGKRIGVGNANEAVELVVAHLPPRCGPAIPGTEDDMPTSD